MYDKEYYQKHKKEYLENITRWRSSEAGKKKFNEYMRKNYYNRRMKLLQNKSCVMCSISDWRVLTFDHITSVSNGGETVKGNLQVLCWNCHRIKSIESRDWKQTKRKINKHRTFNANYSKEKLKEFL
ncbi:HNH endonuclease [archaeon]|nr:MAG: HNH endonuclease [archaeon]